MEVFVEYPFEVMSAIIVLIVALVKSLGWAVFAMCALMTVAYMFKVGGFEQFAFGIITGLAANEITHVIRNKKQNNKNQKDD